MQHHKDNKNIAVIFEVIIPNDLQSEYIDIAANLKTELQKIKGFISVERFQSITTPGKILSLSFWESEEAIKEWRNLERHRYAQTVGRQLLFRDYRIRVAQVIRDYTLQERKEAPHDSEIFHSSGKN